MAVVSAPDMWIVGLEVGEEIKAVEMAGVVIRAVEETEGVKGGVVREENGVGLVRVRG